VTIQA